MNGADLSILRRSQGLTQDEARIAAGVANRGTMVDVEQDRLELTQEEYERIAASYRSAADIKWNKQKNLTREGVMA